MSLDNMLRDFLVDSGLGGAGSTGGERKPRRRAAGAKTEGVLVSCQAGPDDSVSVSHPITPVAEPIEEDELIWWAWNGKLSGFAEW